MRFKLELILIIFLLNGTFCISQTYFDAIKNNKVKVVKSYNTDLNGNKLDYVENSLYFLTEYDTNGNPIFEEKLIKYSDGFELGTPFDNYWVYNGDKLLIEKFSISKDHFIEGINDEKFFIEGGDTNFHYKYKYLNGLKTEESTIVHNDDGTTYTLEIHFEYVTPNNYTSKFNNSVIRFEISDSLELQTRIFTNVISEKNKEEIISTTRIRNSLTDIETDSLIRIFPEFNHSKYLVETKKKFEGNSNKLIDKKTILKTSKNQIGFEIYWGENSQVYNVRKFVYFNTGLLEKVITYSYIGKYNYSMDTFEYEFYR